MSEKGESGEGGGKEDEILFVVGGGLGGILHKQSWLFILVIKYNTGIIIITSIAIALSHYNYPINFTELIYSLSR